VNAGRQPVEQRLANAISSGAQAIHIGEPQHTAAPFTGDNPHALLGIGLPGAQKDAPFNDI